MDIYLYRGEQQEGPFTEDVLRLMIGNGTASPEDMAWHQGQLDWQPLIQILPMPPPPPTSVLPRGISLAAPMSQQVTGEEVLWKGRVSVLKYLGAWFLGLVLAVGGAVSFSSGTPAMVALGIGLFLILCAIIGRARRHYIVTSRKVIIEIGLLIKSSREVRIKDIRSINVVKRGLSGFGGIGTLEFSSAARDDADVIFAGIENVEGVRKMVRRLQDE